MANNWLISQKVDLQNGIDGIVVWPHALLVEGDNHAHTWNVEVVNRGVPANLTGAVTAYFVRPDGNTVVQPGSINKNIVSVTFPQECYAFQGDLKSIMRISNGDDVVTLSATLFHVRSIVTDSIVDPGKVIPSLDDLLAHIDSMNKATSEANSAADNANNAAKKADDAVDNVNSVVDKANSAANSANNAANAANEAAKKAEDSIKNKLYSTTGQNTDGAMNQKAATDAIDAAVDDIKIGGRNYFAFSNMEIGSIASDGTDQINVSCVRTSYINVKDIPISSVVIQAWGSPNALVSNMTFWIGYCYYDDNKKSLANRQTTQYSSDIPDKYINAIYSIPHEASYIRCAFHYTNITNFRAKVEFGNKPTDWSPAPEDVDASIARRAPVTYDYGGARLNDIFRDAAAFKAAVAAGDFSKIHIGDYWEIRLNGTFRDYGAFTVPKGTTISASSDLSSSWQSNAQYEGTYFSDNIVQLSDSEQRVRYANASDCLPYFERTLSNAVVLFEVAAINPYWRYGDSGSLGGAVNHVLFVSRDCLPFALRMRKANTVWEDATTQNPWLGSALYKTLNDPDNGIAKLIKATDIGAYMYEGADGNGMRYYGEVRDSITATTSSGAWASRGRMFLPTEDEIWGRAIYSVNNACAQPGLPIFDGSRRHISKGLGNGASRAAWWCMSAVNGNAANFCLASGIGNPTYTNTVNPNGVPSCFLVS